MPLSNSQDFAILFSNVPDDVLFTIPVGTAYSYLIRGYKNLSDLRGLPDVRNEVEVEAARIQSMAGASLGGEKEALDNAISEARTNVEAAEDYLTVYAQIAAIKSAAKVFIADATLYKGFDVTAACVTNPDFNHFHIGWDLYCEGPRAGYNDDRFENGDVAIDCFVEAWSEPGSTSSLHEIAQTITALPAGRYRLEADIIAANQEDDSEEVTGVTLFAGYDSVPVATGDGLPLHFSLTFEQLLTRDITIGLNHAISSNANWIAMDNVRLIYEGKASAIPQGTDLASDNNARVYLNNVETGKYLSAGHAYGTHAILNETGLPLRLTHNAGTGLWQVYFWEGSKREQLLFSDNGAAYTDYNSAVSQFNPWWNITPTADGTLLIQNQNAAEGQYLGNNPNRQDLQINYSDVTYTDVNANVTSFDNIHWIVLTEEQYQNRINGVVHDTAIADMDDIIYAEAEDGYEGSVRTLTVKLKSTITAVGCSFRLTLPEAFSLATDNDGSLIYTIANRARKLQMNYKDKGNGVYDVAMIPSSETANISGEEGEAISFKLQFPDDAEVGDYNIRLTSCFLQSKVNGTSRDVEMSGAKTTVSVREYLPGDVNGDGKVSPSDAIMILYHYFEVEQKGFNAKVADLTNDGFITPSDAIEALYLYFGTSKNNAPQGPEPQ